MKSARLARKEVRASAPLLQQIRELKKTNRQQREAIDLLLRRVDQLQALTISPADKILKAPSIAEDRQIRLSGTSIKKNIENDWAFTGRAWSAAQRKHQYDRSLGTGQV